MMPSELHRFSMDDLDLQVGDMVRVYGMRDEITEQTFVDLYFGKSRIVFMVHDEELKNTVEWNGIIRDAILATARFYERERVLMDAEK